MDPKEVKLTKLQKVKPFFKAINRVLPWQIFLLLCFVIGMTCSVYDPITVARIPNDIVRLFFNAACFIGTMLIMFISSCFAFMAVGEALSAIKNRFKTIRTNYQEEALKEKKKVLEEVVEKQLLK